MSNDAWTPFPQIEPEETLFGWTVAYSHLAAITEPRDVSRRLCGHPAALLRHDFPGHLDDLCARLSGQLGTSEHLIENHTLLPYFAPFLKASVHASAINAMRTGTDLHLRRLMGLSASRLATDSPLKACPICIDNDLLTSHRALWRKSHQWPTTAICTIHGVPLQIATEAFHNVRRLPLVTPDDLQRDSWVIMPVDRSHLEIQRRLACFTDHFVSQPACRFSASGLRETYAIGARAKGFLALDGSIRLGLPRNAFAAYYGSLAAVPSLTFLGATTGPNGRFLGQILRRNDHFQHPAKHIALTTFLFENWDNFWAAYRQVEELVGDDGEVASRARRAVLDQAIDRVRAGASINSVAQAIGAPVTQLVRYVQKEGIEYSTRSRIVGSDVEPELIALLKTGRTRSSIALRLGIRRTFIKDYLADRPMLKAEWEEQHRDRLRSSHRLRFTRTLARNPGVPIKKIRLLPKNGFQWLYNNDREWLLKVLPALWKR